jgi:hypothetical protein
VRQNEAELVAANVNRRAAGPTEDDEEAVLEALYGPPDGDGIYRGAPVQPLPEEGQ